MTGRGRSWMDVVVKGLEEFRVLTVVEDVRAYTWDGLG